MFQPYLVYFPVWIRWHQKMSHQDYRHTGPASAEHDDARAASSTHRLSGAQHDSLLECCRVVQGEVLRPQAVCALLGGEGSVE